MLPESRQHFRQLLDEMVEHAARSASYSMNVFKNRVYTHDGGT
ncbi:MAG: hypothetical protein BSOLF_2778 [Candidatus Carbobacillus altaicus]|uniref:Uncharacterized protein n=1 Tax=Candidatus Carbonibacillus altaicus TaxID=2163959 RepID=A0A2R6Y211_9BACL|nr:MAG: hypothetical protein BSOLF_2778 [Candidatus Carbobacillus altaicus]